MPEPQGLPLVAHVLGALQDRQSAEAAKLEALLRVTQKLDKIEAFLGLIEAHLAEFLDRERKR